MNDTTAFSGFVAIQRTISMNNFYYQNTTVFGFHGCHKDIKIDLLSGRRKFNISKKPYD